MPRDGASTLGAMESFVPKVASPSTSLIFSPASATADLTARAASVKTDTPELRENSVHPIPTTAACERGNVRFASSTTAMSPLRFGGHGRQGAYVQNRRTRLVDISRR